MKDMKIPTILLISIFSIIIFSMTVKASVPDCEFNLPTIKLNQCQNIIQTCSNCSFVNVTVIYYPPKNGTMLNLEIQMTKHVNVFNYTFCGNSILGTYIVSTFGDPDGYVDTGNICYEVTPTGDNPSGVQGVFYFIPLFTFGFLLFFFSKRFFISSSVSKMPYFLLAYFIGLLPLIFSIYLITSSYLPTFDFLINILYYFFFIVLILSPIIFIVNVGYLIYAQMNKTAKENLIKRGHTEDTANRRLRRK